MLAWWGGLAPGARRTHYRLRDIASSCHLPHPLLAAALLRLGWQRVVVHDKGLWPLWFPPGVDPVRALQQTLPPVTSSWLTQLTTPPPASEQPP